MSDPWIPDENPYIDVDEVELPEEDQGTYEDGEPR